MQELHIARNFIEIIKNETFLDLANLDRLSLYANNIEVVEKGAMEGMTNLTWLLLGNNMLSSLHYGTFDPVPLLVRL